MNRPVLVAMALTLIACTSELEQEIEVPPPGAVLNALLCEDSVITAHVLRTYNGGDPSVALRPDALAIDDAEVEVYLNGVSRGIMQRDARPGWYVLPGCYPAGGDRVRMEVVTAEYAPLSAETALPLRPEILSVDTQRQAPNVVRIGLRFNDRAGEKNYYMLSAAVTAGVEGDSPVPDSPYPVTLTLEEDWLLGNVEYERADDYDYPYAYAPVSRYIFDDAQTDGEAHTLKLSLRGMGALPGDSAAATAVYTCRITFSALSESHYLYLRSKILQKKQAEDVFGSIGLREPIPTYTNISNGYGLLSARQNETIIEWRIENER
jgi:hypothetical protein